MTEFMETPFSDLGVTSTPEVDGKESDSERDEWNSTNLGPFAMNTDPKNNTKSPGTSP